MSLKLLYSIPFNIKYLSIDFKRNTGSKTLNSNYTLNYNLHFLKILCRKIFKIRIKFTLIYILYP